MLWPYLHLSTTIHHQKHRAAVSVLSKPKIKTIICFHFASIWTTSRCPVFWKDFLKTLHVARPCFHSLKVNMKLEWQNYFFVPFIAKRWFHKCDFTVIASAALHEHQLYLFRPEPTGGWSNTHTLAARSYDVT